VPSAANGKPSQYAKDSFSAWTNYSLTDALTISGGALPYMSDRYADTSQPSFRPTGATTPVVTYTFSDNLDVQLNLNNISDERYVTNPYTSHMAQIRRAVTC